MKMNQAKTPLIFSSVFFSTPVIYRNSKSNNLFSWPRAEDFHFLSERVSHPIEQKKKGWMDGWLNTRLDRGGGQSLILIYLIL